MIHSIKKQDGPVDLLQMTGRSGVRLLLPFKSFCLLKICFLFMIRVIAANFVISKGLSGMLFQNIQDFLKNSSAILCMSLVRPSFFIDLVFLSNRSIYTEIYKSKWSMRQGTRRIVPYWAFLTPAPVSGDRISVSSRGFGDWGLGSYWNPGL